MPTFDASHLTSNVLKKLGRAKSGALINLSLRFAKDLCLIITHLMSTPFLTNSLKGVAMVLKFGTNLL